MTSKFNKLKVFARRWGWPRTMYHLLMRGAGKYLGIHVVVVRTRFTTTEISDPCTLPELEYRRLDSDALKRAIHEPNLDLDREFVQVAMERGDLGFGAFDGSKLVSYIWRATDSAPHTNELWVRVRPPYSYSYKSYTRLDYRGKHISPGLMLYSDQEMLNFGYTHRAGFIAVTNFASLAIGKRTGSRVIGHAGYINWFGRHFTYRGKAVAKIGFEFFEPRS